MAMTAQEMQPARATTVQHLPYFTIEEFERIVEVLPERRLELIKGEIKVFPPPERAHQDLISQFLGLCAQHMPAIQALGCRLGGSNFFFEVPTSFRDEQGAGPSDVVPDASICFKHYWTTNKQPPALLIVEVFSFSNQENTKRDLITKAEIYAALQVPTYWVIDRRDQSVWVHTQPSNQQYDRRERCVGDTPLAAPGLEFLQLTPAQIFAE
jgi:Uma2 family endonuclease